MLPNIQKNLYRSEPMLQLWKHWTNEDRYFDCIDSNLEDYKFNRWILRNQKKTLFSFSSELKKNIFPSLWKGFVGFGNPEALKERLKTLSSQQLHRLLMSQLKASLNGLFLGFLTKFPCFPPVKVKISDFISYTIKLSSTASRFILKQLPRSKTHVKPHPMKAKLNKVEKRTENETLECNYH